MNTTKTCTSCQVQKNIDDFNRDKSRKDGLQNRCKECKRATDRKYVSEHKEQNKKRSREWRSSNKVQAQENIKKWISSHPNEYREIQKRSWRKQYNKNKLKKLVSGYIKQALHNPATSKKIFAKLGYTPEQLKQHLESLFLEGMNWDNYGSEWHIDHIIPQSWLPYTSLEDDNFMKCWSLSNLQPLWAKDNISKQNRYSGSPTSIIEYKK
jgi:hypothetical protein